MYSNKENVNILTSLLVAHGVRHAVIFLSIFVLKALAICIIPMSDGVIPIILTKFAHPTAEMHIPQQ